MIRFLLPVLFTFITVFSYGTHNRAGEITYEWQGGYTYKATIRICSNEGSNIADRPELEIHWGDGDSDTVPRVSEIPQPSVGSFNGSENLYFGYHTYPGPGTYEIEVLDPNRNINIENIVNSVNVAFCIRTVLIIDPFISSGNNSCVPQEFPCPEVGCAGVPYCYNAAAVDPDGDSLSYSLVPCMGENANNPADGCDILALGVVYNYPHIIGGGTISIDPENGTVCWISPTMQGEFNFAIAIQEWKYGVHRGTVIRDIQVTILGNCTNNPPDISDPDDTCVVAGANLNLSVTATDADGDNVDITAYGQPLDFTNSPATFSQPVTIVPTTGTFNWNTNCSHIRDAAYQVFFIAEDLAGQESLIDVSSFNINVNPPVVTGLTISPLGSAMNLSWNTCVCTNIKGYKIYRKMGNGTPASGCCDENTPTQMGYTLVGTNVGLNNITFTDNSGLVLGQEYCYVVVVYMSDGATGCPSAEVCDELNLDFPIIINVSVGATDPVNGIDTVRWFHPTELDTVQFPGPYLYKIYQFNGFGSPATVIFTTPAGATLPLTQTELIVTSAISNPMNTDVIPHTYKAELYYTHPLNGLQPVGSTNIASSVFVTLVPSDNAIDVTWSFNVPWTNSLFEVYKETFPGSGIFNLIGTSTTNNYLDTGLINGVTYCYKVKSIGSYTSSQIPSPLVNWSEEECAAPLDMTPPCAPELTLDPDCFIPINVLTWNNPNNSCADDVMSYNLYFTPVEGEPFTLLMSFNSSSDTSVMHLVMPDTSIAGCYYITAVDSAQYGNESLPSNIVCADNCPNYSLPNVFSPNGDGENDLFIPFPYRYIESIELRIYNRWGQVIFETTDPAILWDGKHMENNQEVPAGVYYYYCKVNTIRLVGIEPVELTGFLHLFRKSDNGSN